MVRVQNIQRNNGVAIWRQIADDIRSEITSGRLEAGARIPPETELAERFGVNRHTVRSAISALTQEGVLRAEQGRGTFVANAKRLTHQIGARTRMSQSLASQAHEAKGILVSSGLEQATPDIAAALRIGEGDMVIRLETMHTADDSPVSRATIWFDAGRFPDIATLYQQSGSITVALKAAGIADYFRHSTLISARHADVHDLKYLKLTPGAIVLTARAINVDVDGNPIQFSQTCFSADRMELSVETYPKQDVDMAL